MQYVYATLLTLLLWATSTDAMKIEKINVTTSRSRSGFSEPWERQRLVDGLLEGYDPRIPPNYEEDFPVPVMVQIQLNSIDSISEATMDFSMGMFLRQTWNDSRLGYEKPPRVNKLELDNRLMDKIWVPDLFMANEKKASVHMVTVPNKLMHIYPNGRIQYSLRITSTLKCNMDLRKYPLDSQRCSVIFESYGYSTENLVFLWNPVPLVKDRNLELPQFEMGQIETLRCDKRYVGVDYTCIAMEFELHRSYGFYITQIYVPSVLIVILSWLSFWLDINAVPARISLGLLTVLTMTTQSSGARASLPRVSYVKAIDVWMATCLFFVFAALLEFAYVNVLSRVEKRRQETTKKNNDAAAIEDEAKGLQGKKSKFSIMRPGKEKARAVDKLARLIFPSVFILFNICYWGTYLIWSPDLRSI